MKSKQSYSDKRAKDILDVILSYARLEFDKKTSVSENEDVFDAIGTGVNMLGEELENSTISLREKEQLLMEIHHRVKNNLQIISSLLNLQSESVKDEKFLTLIRESKNRINSMSLIHEMLYASKDMSHIEFKEYLEILYHSIYNTFKTKKFEIEFKLKIEDNIHLGIDVMIPLGLIINEIITNSLKYAFPNYKGIINISVRAYQKGMRIMISDNGIGIDKKFDYENSTSLGIQLIFMLSEQINAEISLNRKKGTVYELLIPNL